MRDMTMLTGFSASPLGYKAPLTAEQEIESLAYPGSPDVA